MLNTIPCELISINYVANNSVIFELYIQKTCIYCIYPILLLFIIFNIYLFKNIFLMIYCTII